MEGERCRGVAGEGLKIPDGLAALGECRSWNLIGGSPARSKSSLKLLFTAFWASRVTSNSTLPQVLPVAGSLYLGIGGRLGFRVNTEPYRS